MSIEISDTYIGGETAQKVHGRWVNGAPDNPANRKSDTQQILEAIAALASGITSRDRQLDALSEAIHLGQADLQTRIAGLYQRIESIEKRVDFEGKARRESDIAVGLLLKGLSEQIDKLWVPAGLSCIGERLMELKNGLEQIETRLARELAHRVTQAVLRKEAAAPKQKQRKGRRK